ncbi:MAG: serine hydrolase, partial [Proteobacteria bacterium]|nr:serine hydrolase [Pseudomonadota bacterium]
MRICWPGLVAGGQVVAAAGKSDVLVWHFMNHAAGLPGTDEPLAGDDLYDWEKVTDVLARQAPWWEPGSASGYHALTQGYLIGEVVR